MPDEDKNPDLNKDKKKSDNTSDELDSFEDALSEFLSADDEDLGSELDAAFDFVSGEETSETIEEIKEQPSSEILLETPTIILEETTITPTEEIIITPNLPKEETPDEIAELTKPEYKYAKELPDELIYQILNEWWEEREHTEKLTEEEILDKDRVDINKITIEEYKPSLWRRLFRNFWSVRNIRKDLLQASDDKKIIKLTSLTKQDKKRINSALKTLAQKIVDLSSLIPSYERRYFYQTAFPILAGGILFKEQDILRKLANEKIEEGRTNGNLYLDAILSKIKQL